jgi:hypothetical protein
VQCDLVPHSDNPAGGVVAFPARSDGLPVTYSIDGVAKLIRTSCRSPLTFAEVVGHFRELKVDPACSGHLDVLLDVSQADSLPASAQLGAVTTELAVVRARVQFGNCAIVATRDAMFGMMRMFEALAANYFEAIHVFRSSAEAEAWLASQRGPGGSVPDVAPL